VIDATSFADPEAAVIAIIKTALPEVFVSNETPSPIRGDVVIVNVAGGGFRAWAEASVNLGVNVYAVTKTACSDLVKNVQDALAVASNDDISSVTVPVGASSVVKQTPPFQRYFAITAYLKGLEDLS